ncbi:MAG: hypothetical protein RI535_08780, partial [Psychroflexus sp.]|nr:hypothetical protein [Psychroflexus sp.]
MLDNITQTLLSVNIIPNLKILIKLRKTSQLDNPTQNNFSIINLQTRCNKQVTAGMCDVDSLRWSGKAFSSLKVVIGFSA